MPRKCIDCCLKIWCVCISEDFVRFLSVQDVFNMDVSSASSKSTVSSPPMHPMETDIREIKKMNWYLGKIDTKGGRRLETIDRDMAFLRKEFARSISRTEYALTRMLAELEIKLEKLELKVVKLEAVKFSGSSSHHGFGLLASMLDVFSI